AALADITLEGDGLHTQCARFLHGFRSLTRLVDVVHHHVRPGFSQPLHGGASDSARAAGDDSHAVAQQITWKTACFRFCKDCHVVSPRIAFVNLLASRLNCKPLGPVYSSLRRAGAHESAPTLRPR